MIEAMRRLPGRKSIVLFSEGVSIPPAVQRLFLGVIDAANRANVSIYTMDAAGLRANEHAGRDSRRGECCGGSQPELSPQQHGERAADQEPREERGRASAGSAHGPRRARAEHRRHAVREHQQPPSGLRTDRHRPSQLLPRRLHARQRDLRRQVPEHRSQGQAAGCHGCRAQGLFRRARHRWRTSEHLGSARACRARCAARAQRVSLPRQRAGVPGERQARVGSGRRQSEDGADVVPDRPRIRRASRATSRSSRASSTRRARSCAR